MILKPLGNSEIQIPEIGMGTWHYRAGPEPLRRGLEAGALLVDTAESYGTEPVTAQAMAGLRERVFVATKVSPSNFRHADVIRAADKSLRRLATEYIDLYQLHEPNPTIPMEETLGAMEDLVDTGKVRFIGVSNFSLSQLQRAQRAMRKHPIVSNQVRFNLVDRTILGELLPYCQANQITIMAYSPLARGLQHILDCDAHGALVRLAGATGRTPAQVALNWCLGRPGITAIPKGNSVAHVLENCGASDWRLNPEQVRELDESILFRRRTPFETFLRRHAPRGIRRAIQLLVRHSPRALRRRVN